MCDKGKSSVFPRQIYQTFATLPLFSWKTQQKAHLGACHFTKLYHLPLPTQQKHVANLVANKTQDVVVDNAQATTKNEKIFWNFSLQRQQKSLAKLQGFGLNVLLDFVLCRVVGFGLVLVVFFGKGFEFLVALFDANFPLNEEGEGCTQQNDCAKHTQFLPISNNNGT